MFGGVNASVPTPFTAANEVALDQMAEHCFWLLANGCNGLAVLDHAGEVASLSIAERIGILEGLVQRQVPASKILAGVGPAGLADAQRIIQAAARLGIRGILLRPSHNGRVVPRDIVPDAFQAIMREASMIPHIYLSLAPTSSTVGACVTALEALLTSAPANFRGIRDESAGCRLGLQVLNRFGHGLEVYTTDDAMLATLATAGISGLISIGGNLISRFAHAALQTPAADVATRIQRHLDSFATVFGDGPSAPLVKALLARNASDPSWYRTRLPLRPVAMAERESLFTAFDATGLRLPQFDDSAGRVVSD